MWVLLAGWLGILSFGLLGCQANEVIQDNESTKPNQALAAKYHTQLGIAYLNQGDTPRAKRKLLTALALAPQSAEAHAAMAFFLEKTGDIKAAKQYYEKALFLAPESGAQQNNYGAFLCRVGQYQEAERYLIKAAEDVHYVNAAMAYENAGLCAGLANQVKKSETYFFRALAQDSTRKVSLTELVKLALKHHEAEKALVYLHQYAGLVLQDRTLLLLAQRAANDAGKKNLMADYRERLRVLNNGEQHEYD